MKTVEELEKEINNVEETLNNLKTKYKTVSDLYCNHHSSYNHCNH